MINKGSNHAISSKTMWYGLLQCRDICSKPYRYYRWNIGRPKTIYWIGGDAAPIQLQAVKPPFSGIPKEPRFAACDCFRRTFADQYVSLI